jgi:hypothetical protein
MIVRTLIFEGPDIVLSHALLNGQQVARIVGQTLLHVLDIFRVI